MNNANLLEIAQAFSLHGQVALWLGSAWNRPREDEDFDLVASQGWTGVWSDSRDPQLADRMEQLWRGEGRPRQLVQVPNALEDALGSAYRLSDFAPYMYLDGKGGEASDADDLVRSDWRVDKIRELRRIESGVLLVAGAQSCDEALRIAKEAGLRAGQLHRIVLLGVKAGTCSEEFERLSEKNASLAARVAFYPSTLEALLREVLSLRVETEELLVRVGSSEVSLDPLLAQEPPITQDYSILTTIDVSPAARSGEEDEQLLTGILSGTTCPWRSIARGFAWDGRTELQGWRAKLQSAIQRVRKGEKNVVVIDVKAEAGSGVTTLLSQLAVHAASQGCPTLYHLGTDPRASYARLRTFLTDLYRDIGGSNALVPAVIIFDVDSYWADTYGYLDILPSKLNRDGRRAILVRAQQIGGPWASDYPRSRGSSDDVEYLEIGQALSENLPTRDARTLATWLEQQYQRLNQDSLPKNWYDRLVALSSDAGCPLLVAVSLLLVERYRDVVRLGERLVSRVNRVVQVVEAEQTPAEAPVEGIAEDAVVRRLQLGCRLHASTGAVREDLQSLAIVLAAMACLRVPVPRQVLGHVAGLDPAEILTAIMLLERGGLVLSREFPQSNEGGAITRGAYRTKPATVQLVHHEYGRLLLECLAEDIANSEWTVTRDAVRDLLDSAATAVHDGGLGLYSIDLLRPVLQRMRPGQPGDREFAEQLTQRFLRVQREKRRGDRDPDKPVDEERTFRRWQWEHRVQVLEAFDWIPAELSKTSASILHSRAITSAKCTRNENADQSRPLYKGAENDLIDALDIDEDRRSDNPVFMLSTLGMVYVHWAGMEREHGDSEGIVKELDDLADDTLREARALQLDSAYPAYHLATHKVDTAEYLLKEEAIDSRERAATRLAEALELLSMEPETRFRAEWDELLRRAIGLLGAKGGQVIKQLKREGKGLGWALEALQELNGEFPREPNPEIGEQELTRAWEILEEGAAKTRGEMPPIVALLRYAVFSFREARDQHPAYDMRLQYLKPIVGTRYFEDEPIWQFDYGMLCYQNGDYEEGARVFRELRRGQRFFYVPNERATVLTEGPDSLIARQFRVQVQSIDSGTGRAWGRIFAPGRFPDPVPLATRAFESRDRSVTVRSQLQCQVTIRPAGPLAEPFIKR